MFGITSDLHYWALGMSSLQIEWHGETDARVSNVIKTQWPFPQNYCNSYSLKWQETKGNVHGQMPMTEREMTLPVSNKP